MNIYDRVLDASEIQAAFDRIATIGVGPSGLAVTEVSFDESSDQLTITWNSIEGVSYRVEYSTSLEGDDWLDFGEIFTADDTQMTRVLDLPANRSRYFVRVLVDN